MISSFIHRHRTLLAGLAVLLLVALLLTPLPLSEHSLAARTLKDAFHVPVFALLLLLVHAVVGSGGRFGGRHALPWSMAITFLMGALIELAQSVTSRSPSLHDVFLNLLGILAGSSFMVSRTLRDRLPAPIRWSAVTCIALATIAIGARPWIEALRVSGLQRRALPVLGDFEHDWERMVWRPAVHEGQDPTEVRFTPDHATSGIRSLEVTTAGAPWSGVRVHLECPARWEPHQTLCLDVFNPLDQPFELGLRIDGSRGERLTGAMTIGPGANSCRVAPLELSGGPKKRLETEGMALEAVILHLGDSRTPRHFFIDRVRLE